jgi:hypothetical protein
MKIWHAHYYDEHEGSCHVWAANCKDLRAEMEDFEKANPDAELLTCRWEDFPTTKRSIVLWLRAHANRENG